MHRVSVFGISLCAPLLIQILAAQAPISDMKLDAAERQLVLNTVIADVKQYYFDRNIALNTANALLVHERAGDYNQVTDGQAFANLLTRHLIDASRDVHFTMEYTRNVFPDYFYRLRNSPFLQVRE
jgi:hypothetical protein